MTSDAILAELRGMHGAPDTLRERVLALPEPQPRVGGVVATARLSSLCSRRGARGGSHSVSARRRCTACVSGGSGSRPVGAVEGNQNADVGARTQRHALRFRRAAPRSARGRSRESGSAGAGRPYRRPRPA